MQLLFRLLINWALLIYFYRSPDLKIKLKWKAVACPREIKLKQKLSFVIVRRFKLSLLFQFFFECRRFWGFLFSFSWMASSYKKFFFKKQGWNICQTCYFYYVLTTKMSSPSLRPLFSYEMSNSTNNFSVLDEFVPGIHFGDNEKQ